MSQKERKRSATRHASRRAHDRRREDSKEKRMARSRDRERRNRSKFRTRSRSRRHRTQQRRSSVSTKSTSSSSSQTRSDKKKHPRMKSDDDASHTGGQWSWKQVCEAREFGQTEPPEEGPWRHDRWPGVSLTNLSDPIKSASSSSKEIPSTSTSSSSKAVPEVTKSGSMQQWACESCTFLNHALLKNCEMCEAPRCPTVLQGIERQWMCAVCAFMNHPALSACEKCNVGRGARAFLEHLAVTKGRRAPNGAHDSSRRR